MHTHHFYNFALTATTVLLYLAFTKKAYCHYNIPVKTLQIIMLLFERYCIFAVA